MSFFVVKMSEPTLDFKRQNVKLLKASMAEVCVEKKKAHQRARDRDRKRARKGF